MFVVQLSHTIAFVEGNLPATDRKVVGSNPTGCAPLIMAELSIISPVLIVVTGGYLSIFPKIAGNNFDKLALCSLVCWSFVLVLVGLNYWGSGYEFSLLLFTTNWFWFTVIVNAAIEIPFFIWYCKKHDVSFEMKD